MAETNLRDVLERIRKGGWFKGSTIWQGNYENPYKTDYNVPRCMTLAVIDHPVMLSEDMLALAEVCAEQFPSRVHPNLQYMALSSSTVISVNNHPDTTFTDVEMLMEKAAVRREEMIE